MDNTCGWNSKEWRLSQKYIVSLFFPWPEQSVCSQVGPIEVGHGDNAMSWKSRIGGEALWDPL